MFIKRLSILAVAVTLVACASTQPAQPVQIVQAPVVMAPPQHPYALPERAVRSAPKAPSWFVNLPEDTADMTFAVGTATSTDEQMAYDKARMAAERKLVEQMYSRITTQTNSFKADRGAATIENYQQVTRKNARGELSGAQRVDSQATFDGQNYKVYVLIRLPLGANNAMQTRRDQQRLQREADVRSRAAEREMDTNESRDVQRERDDLDAIERSVAPKAKAAPAQTGEIQLLDVDNVAYKQRRDEALQKPGAVIGQSVMR